MELFEVAPHLKKSYVVAKAFLENIIWRRKETITDKTKNYIDDILVQNQSLEHEFIKTVLYVTSRPKHYFNSDFLHKLLMELSMADRDAWWTQIIYHQYRNSSDEISPVQRMIDWAWTDESRENISEESIRLMCQTIIWFLTSSNRKLRDSATKATICLLQERINVLITLIKTFEKVNDPYVLQRLYAIAFGCAVRTSNTESLKDLGVCIYESVFDTENVFPDILLRDYARQIIDYATFKGHQFKFDLNKTKPPFKSDLPSAFPSNEDIEKYIYDSNATSVEDHHSSLTDIIRSMKTNFLGRLRGDFDLYIFEVNFKYWRVNPQLLSNLAVEWIVKKYGYDVERHGEFDRTIPFFYGKNSRTTEGIGRKYQWIAFYELLARVSDNLPFYADTYSTNDQPIPYNGPWRPFLRDIDPTITIKGSPDDRNEKNWWNPVDYECWRLPNKDWIFKTDDLPDPLRMISVFDKNGVEWLVLEISKSWPETPGIGDDNYPNIPQKQLWYQIRSYITRKMEHKKILTYLKRLNFVGRWMPESNTIREMFSREYYWSTANETFRTPDYYGDSWSIIRDQETSTVVGNVAVTAIKYAWEEEYDASKESSISFYKPSEILFKLLDLQYSKIEGQLVNKNGETICFDPSTTPSTHSCLVVRKSELIQKLEENELDIFWTVLGEKLIYGGNYVSTGEQNGWLNISGVVYHEKGSLKHIPSFVEDK